MLAVGGPTDDAQLVAQPLHRRAGDRDRTLKGVNGFRVTELVAHRGQQTIATADDLLAGVEEEEVARAVGVLGLAGLEADLAHHRGLLIAEACRHRDGPTHRSVHEGRSVRLGGRGRADGREHLARNPEEGQQFVVPIQGLQIHQHGATGVGGVGHVDPAVRAAGDVPQHPHVRSAEQRVTAFGIGANAGDVLENPLQLAAGEVGGRREPGFASNHLPPFVVVQRGGDLVGAGVLPDDRVVIRLTRLAVPDDRGLALVGDAQRRDVGGFQTDVVQRRGHHGLGVTPDLGRVVLDPAGARQDLLVLELVAPDLQTVVVEDHAAGAGGALVDRGDEVGHDAP